MSPPVSLLFGIHAHQPVGNFPEVLTDAHVRCYQPFIHMLYRYPDFHFAVHFSGWLLDYLITHYPEDIDLLHEMVGRGQVELFGAGYTEPVLAAIPFRDRIGQIETFSRILEQKLGARPKGAWLTERVWESTVVPALVDCGVRYVIVDDYHFLCAGKKLAELNGFFTTEENTRILDIFPISETLRYKLPFSPAADAVTHIESLADKNINNSKNAAIYFDDIEKFGIWPETYEWVYEKGWLEQFIQGVLASPKIISQHYHDYHATEKTRGIVYLPTTSYIEMNEWTLPAESANFYADLINEAKTCGWFDQKKAFLRGGIWKNFFSRYPESNWMHKRMLALSARFAALPEKQHTEEMQQKLYQSQANDAYWHGLFGGIYLPHLRRAIYTVMVSLEAMLDACTPRPSCFTEDTDLDGFDETYLQNGILQVIVKLDNYACISELDAYFLNHNFGDTLRCQDEHYYKKIQTDDIQSLPTDKLSTTDGIASAHDRIHFKDVINAHDLQADDYPQGLFIDRINNDFLSYQQESLADKRIIFLSTTNEHNIHKHFELSKNVLQVIYLFEKSLDGIFSTEINLAMPSCDGPGGRYLEQDTVLGGFGQLLELNNVSKLMLDDTTLGGNIILSTSIPATLTAQPHFSISQSESGFEKIMQAVSLKLEWPVIESQIIISLDINKGP